MNSAFVLRREPIDFCPHCGYRNGKVWASYEEARRWAMALDWGWLRALGRQPIGCQRGDGSWLLGFAAKPEALAGGGRFVATRALIIDDREVAARDAGASAPGGGGRARAQGAFGGGGDGWSGGEAPLLGEGQLAGPAQGAADDGLEID
jgi:hypothetical protein